MIFAEAMRMHMRLAVNLVIRAYEFETTVCPFS